MIQTTRCKQMNEIISRKFISYCKHVGGLVVRQFNRNILTILKRECTRIYKMVSPKAEFYFPFVSFVRSFFFSSFTHNVFCRFARELYLKHCSVQLVLALENSSRSIYTSSEQQQNSERETQNWDEGRYAFVSVSVCVWWDITVYSFINFVLQSRKHSRWYIFRGKKLQFFFAAIEYTIERRRRRRRETHSAQNGNEFNN